MDARDYSVDMSHPSLKGLISKGAPLIIATKEEVAQMLPNPDEVLRCVKPKKTPSKHYMQREMLATIGLLNCLIPQRHGRFSYVKTYHTMRLD